MKKNQKKMIHQIICLPTNANFLLDDDDDENFIYLYVFFIYLMLLAR